MGPAAWDRLALAAPFPSVFMSWAWHTAWNETAPRSAREDAFVLSDYDAGQRPLPAVLLPLGWRRTRLHHLYVRSLRWSAVDVGTPDHLDLLVHPESDSTTVAGAILDLPWDVLVLTNLVERFPQVSAVLSALRLRGCETAEHRLWSCSQIELPGTWEEYLGGLSAKRRHRIRKDERDLCAAHDVRLVDFGAELEEGWSHLLRLHDSRWNGNGSFGDDRRSAMFRRFAGLLQEQGRLGLFGLSVNGEITAVDFWAEFGDTLFGIQSGRSIEWNRWSVGRVLRGMSLRHAITKGLRRADFSRGTDPYKREWCPIDRWCYEVRVFRPTLRGRVHAGIESLVHTARTLRRSLRGIAPAEESGREAA